MAANLTVSWLKFEPRVSNFPVLEARRVASSTAATMGSLFLFNGSIIGYVCKWTSLIVVLGRQQTFRFIAAISTIGSLFLFREV